MSDHIDALLRIRSQRAPLSNTVWLQKPFGVNMVEVTAFEPDPNTYRHDYYYHAVRNQLFVKVQSRNNQKIWKVAN